MHRRGPAPTRGALALPVLLTVLLLLSPALAGCTDRDRGGAGPDGGDAPGTPAATANLDRGAYSERRTDEAELLSFHDEAEWSAFWRNHTGGDGDPPDVDFATHIAVAVLMGERPTGGHSVRVDNVTWRDGAYRVDYTTLEPGESCHVTQALSYPYHVVSVERVDADGGAERPAVVEGDVEHVVQQCG